MSLGHRDHACFASCLHRAGTATVLAAMNVVDELRCLFLSHGHGLVLTQVARCAIL